MSVLDKITMGDLDENQQQVAETVGLDNYKKLVAAYGAFATGKIMKPHLL